MITPPLSISAMPRFTRAVPVCGTDSGLVVTVAVSFTSLSVHLDITANVDRSDGPIQTDLARPLR
jgi:hypothetical protein